MKKFGKMRVIIPFLCAVLFVWSCSQKDVSTQESTIGRTGVSDLFFQNLEIAKVHSSGLEFVYERISKMPRSGFRSVDVRIFEAYADSLLRYTHEYAVLSSSLGVELIEKEGDELKRGMRRVAGDDASSAAQSAILAGFMAATGVGAPGAGAAICASAVVGSAWGATARALGI